MSWRASNVFTGTVPEWLPAIELNNFCDLWFLPVSGLVLIDS